MNIQMLLHMLQVGEKGAELIPHLENNVLFKSLFDQLKDCAKDIIAKQEQENAAEKG